ncbi:MAG: alpha/beta hydrolase [Deltaproteobacteria bacterium]|nr:alpha/beta hydrolase [Deltaproteobacteria bacterium]
MGEPGPEERWLEVNGVKLHYLEWGDHARQPMILLHGFLGHARVWDDFALSSKRDYHVLALDQRGHGQSQWAADGAYSLDDYFSDLAEFIKLLGLNNLILVGHSMGGRNALFYTACLPDRVNRLILVDARAAASQRSTMALNDLLNRIRLESGTLEEMIQEAQAAYPSLSRETCHRLIIHACQVTAGARLIPRYDVRMKQMAERPGFILEDLRPLMGNITCLTLVIRGEESLFLSRLEAEEMCQLMQNAEWTEISAASHLPVQENPTAFKEAVSSFLD